MARAPAQTQMSPQQMAAYNASMRSALISTGIRSRKNLATVTSALGQSTRVKLFNVGIGVKLQIDVSCAVTIGTAAAVPSPKAPWNLISRIRLTDFDGTDRVNFSGFQLFVLNCIRAGQLYGYANTPNTPTFTNPVVPTATGNGVIQFILDIPIAYDADNPIVQLRDLRGAMMMQTAVGECYLNIDWSNNLISNTGDNDAVYSGAGTTTVVGNGAQPVTCQITQEFIMPQAVGGNGAVPLPMLDLQTVYEINGNVRSGDNLAINAEKLISYPNVRSVIGVYAFYRNGGVLSDAINGMRVIANGNNIVLDYPGVRQKKFEQRRWLQGADFPSGVFMMLHKDKPIETSLFGNVQLGITPSTAVNAVGSDIELGFESFYTKGAALPGVSQAQ